MTHIVISYYIVVGNYNIDMLLLVSICWECFLYIYVLNCFSEWNVKDNRSEETYFQVVARGVHRAGEDRKYLYTQPIRATSIRPWRIIEILYHSNSSARRRRN